MFIVEKSKVGSWMIHSHMKMSNFRDSEIFQKVSDIERFYKSLKNNI